MGKRYDFSDETSEGLLEYWQFVGQTQQEFSQEAETYNAAGNNTLYNLYANKCNRLQVELEDLEEEINKRLQQ
jgi:hypothetical protein